ncbi:MAG: hypothetical protein HYR56_31400 [Acidobacteria bacterium]|nr:hypothetical protein [Acidobacteriota bacterium]MBI3427542.1 hypothetical protein [Acidobacteriota bacterium]
MEIELPRTKAQLNASFPGYSATLLREEIYTYAMRLERFAIACTGRLRRDSTARVSKRRQHVCATGRYLMRRLLTRAVLSQAALFPYTEVQTALVALGVSGNLLGEDERLDRATKARLTKVDAVFQQEWKGH